MSLYTGKILHSYQFTELPIDDDVISKVRDLAEEDNVDKTTENYLMFEWAPGVLITDDVSKEDTPTREEIEISNNEHEGEVNVEEASESKDNDEAEDIEDKNDNN